MEKQKYYDFKRDFKHLTKDQILKAIEELSEQSLVSEEMNIESILSSGQIDETTFLFKDEKEGYILERFGQLTTLKETNVKSYLAQKFNYGNIGYLSNKMYFIPQFCKVFNPLSLIRIYENRGIKYFNTFFPSEFIKHINEVKDSNNRRVLDIDLVKRDYKHIYLLLENLFKEDKHIEYFLNWFSASLNEREKLGVCVILKGAQGTGKNFLFEHLIQPSVGREYTKILDNTQLQSKFNGSLTEALFVLWNEIKGDFKDSSTTADKMKALISEGDIVIEKKGQDANVQQTYFNSLIFSNHTLPFEVAMDDRRFFVIETKIENLKEVVKRDMNLDMKTYIKNFDEEVSNFLRYIVSLDYDLEKARTAPATKEKLLVAEGSSSQMEKLRNSLKRKRTKESLSWLYENFLELYTASESYTKDHYLGDLKLFIKEVADGKISNDSLIFAYKYFVNPAAIPSKMQKDLKVEFGESQRTKSFRYKYLGEPIDFNVELLFANDGATKTELTETEKEECRQIINHIINYSPDCYMEIIDKDGEVDYIPYSA